MSELPPIPNSNQHSANVCPLCEKEIQKKSALYGVTVCKKCNRSFVGKRQFAIVIDGLIIYLAISPIYILGLPPLVEIFIIFLWYIVAFPFKDAFNGQSLGKKLFGLKVIDKQNGAPISIKQSIIRNCFWGIPYISYITGLICLIQSYKGPRLGDSWANSKVIWSKYADRSPFASES